MGQLTLILGGAKSGKTSAALSLCETYPAPRIYLATAESRDEETAERILRHQAERGPEWSTIEESRDPALAISGLNPDEASVVLMDCLTMWLGHLMADKGLDVDSCARRVRGLGEAILEAACPVVVVSNEVGHGIVPDNKLARDFRDASGLGHQILAALASEVYFVTAGLLQQLK